MPGVVVVWVEVEEMLEVGVCNGVWAVVALRKGIEMAEGTGCEGSDCGVGSKMGVAIRISSFKTS